MKSPPSSKASATATGGITEAATVGIEALVLLHAGEQALVFLSQHHDGHQAQYEKCQCQECCEGSSPGAAGGGGRVHEVLEAARHLELRELVKVNGYVCQEEAQDEVVNVQA